MLEDGKVAELLLYWTKYLIEFCLSSCSEFECHWGQLSLSSLWSWGNKYQLSPGFSVIDETPSPLQMLGLLPKVERIIILLLDVNLGITRTKIKGSGFYGETLVGAVDVSNRQKMKLKG